MRYLLVVLGVLLCFSAQAQPGGKPMYEARKLSGVAHIFKLFGGMPRDKWVDALTVPLPDGPGFEDHEAYAISGFMDSVQGHKDGLAPEALKAKLEDLCASNTRAQIINGLVNIRRYEHHDSSAPDASASRLKAFMAREGISFDDLETWALDKITVSTSGDYAWFRSAMLTSRVQPGQMGRDGNPEPPERIGEHVWTLDAMKQMCELQLAAQS